MAGKKQSVCLTILILFALWSAGASFQTLPATAGSPAQASQEPTTLYVPVVGYHYPYLSPFSVESTWNYLPGSLILSRLLELGSGSVRINVQISWRALQPAESDPINWSVLSNFDASLRQLKAAGIAPVVIVDDYPRWATQNDVRQDGEPTSCGPLRLDKFSAFAQFLYALVNRYKTPEFGVQIWELGNEPDVDPNLVPADNMFGCWGKISDPYYGGLHYGEMVKAVSPAIKAADPTAQVWIGGLLLDNPNTTNPALGKPELFLKGILESGAAPYFDAVPYHWYPPYANLVIDHDNELGTNWKDLGGGTVGKARFLRTMMAAYGVDKPLHLNETGLMCPETIGGQTVTYCTPTPVPEFFEMQANHLVRSFVRGLNEKISSFSWYTLEGPGWRFTGLLNGDLSRKPVYIAYRTLTQQLRNARLLGTSYFGDGLEAYAFQKDGLQVHVVWAKDNTSYTVSIPASRFQAAYDRNGDPITPTIPGSDVQLNIGFNPVYLILSP